MNNAAYDSSAFCTVLISKLVRRFVSPAGCCNYFSYPYLLSQPLKKMEVDRPLVSQSSLCLLSVFTAIFTPPDTPAIYSHLLPPCKLAATQMPLPQIFPIGIKV